MTNRHHGPPSPPPVGPLAESRPRRDLEQEIASIRQELGHQTRSDARSAALADRLASLERELSRLQSEAAARRAQERLERFAAEVRAYPAYYSPIRDPQSGETIGYHYSVSGYERIHDLQGSVVAQGEEGLDRPLVDPIDFVPTPGAVASIIRAGGRLAGTVFARALARGGTRAAAGLLTTLRVAAARDLRGRILSAMMQGSAEAAPIVGRGAAGLAGALDRSAVQHVIGSVTSAAQREGAERDAEAATRRAARAASQRGASGVERAAARSRGSREATWRTVRRDGPIRSSAGSRARGDNSAYRAGPTAAGRGLAMASGPSGPSGPTADQPGGAVAIDLFRGGG